MSAEVTRPFGDRASEGMLQFSTSFSGMSEPGVDASTRWGSDRAIEVGRIVEKSIRESKAVDTEALCIVPGEKVWSVRCDVHVLDHEGNVVDCAVLAAITALHAFRRPDVTVVGDAVTVHSMEDKQPVPLAVHHVPLAFTFAFFPPPPPPPLSSSSSAGAQARVSGDDDDATGTYASSSSSVLDQSSAVFLCAVDPSLKEEQAMSGSMTVTLNAHNEVCCIHKAGGLPITIQQLLECQRVASAKVTEVTRVVKQALQSNALTPKQRQALLLARQGEHSLPRTVSTASTAVPSVPRSLDSVGADELRRAQLAPRSRGAGGPSGDADAHTARALSHGNGDGDGDGVGDGDGDENMRDLDALADSLNGVTSSTSGAWFTGGAHVASSSSTSSSTAWDDDGEFESTATTSLTTNTASAPLQRDVDTSPFVGGDRAPRVPRKSVDASVDSRTALTNAVKPKSATKSTTKAGKM